MCLFNNPPLQAGAYSLIVSAEKPSLISSKRIRKIKKWDETVVLYCQFYSSQKNGEYGRNGTLQKVFIPEFRKAESKNLI